MNIDCLVRPKFESYQLPSDERKLAAPTPRQPTVVLVSDRLQRLLPIRLVQQVYRMTGEEHFFMKRALLASVKIRSRLQRG